LLFGNKSEQEESKTSEIAPEGGANVDQYAE